MIGHPWHILLPEYDWGGIDECSIDVLWEIAYVFSPTNSVLQICLRSLLQTGLLHLGLSVFQGWTWALSRHSESVSSISLSLSWRCRFMKSLFIYAPGINVLLVALLILDFIRYVATISSIWLPKCLWHRAYAKLFFLRPWLLTVHNHEARLCHVSFIQLFVVVLLHCLRLGRYRVSKPQVANRSSSEISVFLDILAVLLLSFERNACAI